jgi:nucleoside-diphosphate-sugar epimerase
LTRVLVTGARGFVGAHLADDLERRGFEVLRARRPRAGTPPDPRFLDLDLTQPFALPRDIGAVVHAAATSPGPGVSSTQIVRDSVHATANLIGASARIGVRQLVYLSSLSVYGRIDAPEVNEDTPRRDPDVYGASKHLAEELVREHAGVAATIALRLPGVVGRGAARNWLATLLAQLRAGREVSFFNPEARFNNAVHVAELSALVARLLERGWRGFDALTLGAAGALPVRDVVAQVAEHAGSRSTVRAQAAAERRSFTVSSARAIERHGYAPSEIGALLKRWVSEELEATSAEQKGVA